MAQRIEKKILFPRCRQAAVSTVTQQIYGICAKDIGLAWQTIFDLLSTFCSYIFSKLFNGFFTIINQYRETAVCCRIKAFFFMPVVVFFLFFFCRTTCSLRQYILIATEQNLLLNIGNEHALQYICVNIYIF